MAKTVNNHITLDREGNKHAKRLRRSLNKIKWSRALMQICWKAGPVTALGLAGGYYIGYGEMPSTQLLLYFVSFTIFSGVIGLIAKVVYDGTRGHLEEQNERAVLNVTDTLGDLVLIIRDKVVQTFEGENRHREAALQLLRRVDLTPYGVNIAFTDLTGSSRVGEIMGQIFAYRRIGLQTKVREIYADHRELIDKTADELSENSPQAANELQQWFTGNTAGMLKYGVERENHFLQRIMSAIEHNNLYLMTFRDVEEMMILAFELISGREIPTLIFSYPRNWKYARILDDLQNKRSRYRVAQAKGANRIRALAAYLIETGYSSSDELPEGLKMGELVERVSRCMDRISEQIEAEIKKEDFSPSKIQRLSKIMNNCVELYSMAREGYRESQKTYRELSEAAERWRNISREAENGSFSLKISGRKGIRIKESVISLDEEACLSVCRHLWWYFNREGSNTDNINNFPFSSFKDSGALAARRLAIEIAVALETHIQLSKPEIQRNINATKAIYLGDLSPDMSAVQKQELGRSMAREAENGLGTAATRLAETLVHQYHVELSDDAKEFLQYNYNADPEALSQISEKQSEIDSDPDILQDIPPEVDAPKSQWKKSLQTIKKVASKV